jgi:pSer/pThr/pTyr-binding forkhead associated (FHA) protein
MSELSLEIVEGPGAGRQVPLGEPLVLGRDPGVELVLADPQVSRRHARISPKGAGAVVEDLGSSNGTFVNGAQLHAPALAGPGDDVLIGVTVVEIRSLAQIARAPSAVRPVPAAIAAQRVAAPQPPPPPPPAAAALAPAPRVAVPGRELAALFDVHVKRRARTAPLAVLALVALVVLVYLAAK